MEIKKKNAIVTGAARGIGRAIALKLADAGSNVALVDLGNASDPALTYSVAESDELQRARKEVQSRGVKAVALSADVTRFDDCRRMAEQVREQLGGIDILVNNAGVIAVGSVAGFAEEQWDRVMTVNAKGTFLCSKACIPHMLDNRQGAIINISSIAGKTGRAGLAAYCASKFAIIGFTQALAEELGAANIRVNAVCPGVLRTAMWTDVLNKLPGESWRGKGDNLQRAAATLTFLRREQDPADIGEAVVFLCRADNVTGVALNVAGGAEMH